MKNLFKWFGLIAIVAVIGFTFAACGDGNGGGGGNGTRDPKTYTGTAASGVTYTLKIEDSGSRAVLTPTQGDKYTLTQTANSKKSTGKVNKVVGSELTLSPVADPDDTFTATVSGNNITAMSGDITWDDGDANTAPTTLTPSGNTDPGIGRTFTLTGIPARFNGKYAYCSAISGGDGPSLIGAQSVRIDGPTVFGGVTFPRGIEAQTLPQISGGRVSFPMWFFNPDDDSYVRYSGNDLYAVTVYICNNSQHNELNSLDEIARALTYVASFKQGNVTIAWDDKKLFELE